MANTYFVGMRADADLVSNERPQSWREGILRLYPNGMAPLTALTALMPTEKVTDAYYHWWQKSLPAQRATGTANAFIYDEVTFATAYSGSGVAGQTVYVKVTTAIAKEFRTGHTVLLRDADDPYVDVVGRVTNVVAVDGTYSAISVYLLEADDNASATTGNDLQTADTILVVGNANAQGATRPEAISYGPEQRSNRTQIFRTSLDLSRTLMETKLRTEDAYQATKRDTLELHAVEIERSFMFGINTTGTGDNGKPITYTEGIVNTIKSYGTVDAYNLDTAAAYAGKDWLDRGDRWINELLELIFRFGGSERLCYLGSGAMLGIQNLVQELGLWTLNKETKFGIKVTVWQTVFGDIMLKTHPLFSYEATTRNAMLLFEPKNIRYKYITDTRFAADSNYGKGGGSGKDGKEEDWLTEAGLEMHFPETGAWLTGVGLNNSV